MANPKNKQSGQSESTQKNQNNVSEFTPQSSKDTAFGSGGSSTQTGTTSPGGASTGGGMTSPQGGSSFRGGSSSQGGSSTQGSGQGTTGAATATAKSFIDQAKETAGQAYEAVTEKAATKLDERKSTLTTGLTTVADSVRQVSANLGSAKTESGLAEAAAKYTDTAARKLQDVAGYFDNRSVRDMARDVEGFARRNPAVFLGAAFGLGLLAARFLKSTPTGYSETGADRQLGGSAGTTDRQLNAPSSPTATGDFSSKPM